MVRPLDWILFRSEKPLMVFLSIAMLCNLLWQEVELPMTAREPQQEYIITEEMFQQYRRGTITFQDIEERCRSRPHPAPAFKRCCDSCINVPCKVLNRVPCLAQEKQENICEENGCTDIENCDEICQHSRIFSPLQLQEAKTEAARKAREDVLDELRNMIKEKMLPPNQQWEAGMFIQYEDVLKMIKSLRQQDKGGQG